MSLWRHLCHVTGIVDVKHCWHRIRVTNDSYRRSSDQSYYRPLTCSPKTGSGALSMIDLQDPLSTSTQRFH
jgi:hypothetical protein